MIVFFFLVIYGIFLFGIILLGFYRQIGKEYGSAILEKGKEINSEDLVVIIPFRNENNRLHGIIRSIKNSTILPKEFIFVNDHSEDNSEDIIESALKEFPIRIINLGENQKGKKKAIRKGIAESSSKFILCLDADIEFSSDYFEALEHLMEADLYVLPVILKADNWYEHFFELDVHLASALNMGLTGIHRPIFASGANLLLKRESFEKWDNLASHEHIASGDDIYLLRDFRNQKADVRLMSNYKLAVHTETPKTLSELFHQRLRWLKKTSHVKDHLSTALAIIQSVFTAVFLTLLIYASIHQEWMHLLILVALKTGLDMIVFLPYFNRIRRLKTWIIIPIYELVFPFYSLSLLLMMFWFKPEWKGRY